MNLSKKQKINILSEMILIRRTEERIMKEYRNGNVFGAIHLSIGQEAVPVGVCLSLRDDDFVFSTHRGHGHAIAKGVNIESIMAELMGRDTGCSRGHGGSMHIFDSNKGFMGGNGIVGGSIPIALGSAFTAQYKGTDQVTVCFFSDGASNQGVFHESLNLASLWKLPVVYICENNCYAATTPVKLSCSNQDIAERAKGYNMPGIIVDGNDVFEVHKAASRAVDEARQGKGPSLVECKTYRIEPHCGIIKDERKPGEREAWLKKDPIERLKMKLMDEKLISDREINAIEEDVKLQLQKAVEYGLNSPFPDVNAGHNARWEVF